MKEIKNYGCNTLQEILDYAPCCVEHDGKTFCLHFFKSSHGYIAEYSFTEEKITVGLHGVRFLSRENLFDTYRRNDTLFDTLKNLLDLLYENRSKLRFIPRIHPFNEK